jgi:hypothetical protein
MKLKNVTKEVFSLEGVTIGAGEVQDVKDETAQRLLSLYYPETLIPIDPNVFKSPKEVLNEKAESAPVDAAPAPVAKEFKCPNHPAKTFSSEAKLKAHTRLADKPKEETSK